MYKFSISVLGTKGGSSKTTTSHLLALGLAKFRCRAVLMTTDHSQGRKSLSDANRPYSTYEARTQEQLDFGIKTFQNVDVSEIPAVLILDGGGNRTETDKAFASFSDMILLPFRDSAEDFRVILEDMKRLPEAFALPAAWSTNHFVAKEAIAILNKMEGVFPGRMLNPVPTCRATQQLLRENPGQFDSTVVSIAKALAEQVLTRLGVNVFD